MGPTGRGLAIPVSQNIYRNVMHAMVKITATHARGGHMTECRACQEERFSKRVRRIGKIGLSYHSQTARFLILSLSWIQNKI